VLAVVCILAVIVIAFTILYVAKKNTMKALDERYVDVLSYQQYLDTKENTLQETLAMMGTDAFIESQARDLYGYMKSDEIRFVITDPEVLYGTSD